MKYHKKIEKTYEALQKAIDICKPGTMYREVGNIIGKYCEENGFLANLFMINLIFFKIICCQNIHWSRNRKTFPL